MLLVRHILALQILLLQLLEHAHPVLLQAHVQEQERLQYAHLLNLVVTEHAMLAQYLINAQAITMQAYLCALQERLVEQLLVQVVQLATIVLMESQQPAQLTFGQTQELHLAHHASVGRSVLMEQDQQLAQQANG